MNFEEANGLELFFAGLDESTVEELIEIYENGDEDKLDEYFSKLPNDVPKEELHASLSMLKEIKETMFD